MNIKFVFWRGLELSFEAVCWVLASLLEVLELAERYCEKKATEAKA